MSAESKKPPERRTNGHGVELPARPRPERAPEETRAEAIRAVVARHREALDILARG